MNNVLSSKYIPLYWTTLPFWLAVFINIFVVSMFETIFYFFYATNLEKQVLEGDIDRYTDLMSRQILHITDNNQKQQIIDILHKNIKSLDSNIEESTKEHEQQKKTLINKAIVYECIVLGLVVFTLIVSIVMYYYKNRTMVGWFGSLHLGHIMIELSLVLVLYIAFDFIYVNMVVQKWQSMKSTEFQKHIIKGSKIENRTIPALKRKYTTVANILQMFQKAETC